MSQNINETLVKSELKLAETASADTGIQNARIQELEATVTRKNRIISLLKDQATISIREIAEPDTSLYMLQLGTTEQDASRTWHNITSWHTSALQLCQELNASQLTPFAQNSV